MPVYPFPIFLHDCQPLFVPDNAISYSDCDMRVFPALDLLSRTDLRMYMNPVPRCVRGTFRLVGVSSER